MKFVINIKWWLLLFVIIWSSSAFAQGIRKDYTEMTDDERDALISAYWALGNDQNQNGPVGGLVGEIGDFHQAHFNLNNAPDPIHFNTENLDVFLAWHRQGSVELQRAIKEQLNNEWITIPYWDWTFSNSKSDPLWSSNWLGSFDSAWSLSRLSSSSQTFPTQADINSALTETDFYQFSRWEVEQNAIHVRGHTWTGGVMASGDSPKDPTFFFHHNMVDKIWADWYEIYGDCPGGCYIKTNMPRYDGTETNALGQQLPSIDPDDIVDPRSLGIFYSDRTMGRTVLDKYAVSNSHTFVEKFGYQYKIQAKDDFLVSSGKNAEFRSCKAIELLPGFKADNGAVFGAKIDLDCDFSTNESYSLLVGEGDIYDRNKAENIMTASSGSISTGEAGTILPLAVKNFPNPFTGQTTIEFDLPEDADVTLFVSDINGKQIARLLESKPIFKGTHQLVFDGSNYPAGMYYYTIQAGNEVVTQKMTLIK